MAALAARERAFPREGLRAFAPLWMLLLFTAFLRAFIPCRVPADAVAELVRWAVLLLFGAYAYDLLCEQTWRRRLSTAFVGSALAASALGLAQWAGWATRLFPVFDGMTQRMYSVFGNQDLLGGYIAIAMPIAVSRFLDGLGERTAARNGKAEYGLGWARTGVFGAALCVMPACLLLTGSRTAWLAASAGAGLVLLWNAGGWRRGVIVGGLMGAVAVLTIAFAPQATMARLRTTFRPEDVGARARVWIWHGTLRMIRAHPVLGVGPGNYPYWSPYYLGEALQAPEGREHYRNTTHTLHAHCEPMEWLAETGLAGALCALWMAARLRARLCAPVRRPRAPEWGALTALGVFSLFNPALHSAPHALAAVLLAAAVLARGQSIREDDAPPVRVHWAARLMPLSTFALALFVLYCVVMPSWRLRTAEQLHLSGQSSFEAYAKAINHPWPNASAHEKYGIALFEARRDAEAKEQLEQALAGLDTGGVHLLLGIIAARQGDSAAARTHLEQCLFRWPSNDVAWRQWVRARSPS